MQRLALTAAAIALTASPGRAGMEVLSQDREVLVDIDVVEDFYASCTPQITPGCLPDSTTTTNFADSAAAPDAAPFSATASEPAFPATFATQDSAITPTLVSASGSHAATATFSNTGGFPITFHSEFHDADSRVIIAFELDTATAYVLTGSVSTGGAVFSTSSARLSLTGPGGAVAEVQVDSDPDCATPDCFTVGPEPLAASGVLVPGSYALEARASGTAGGVHSTNGSFGTGIDGAFDVELALAANPVPVLGVPSLVALAFLLGATGLRSVRSEPAQRVAGRSSGAAC